MFGKLRHIHFIGIGGAGMSGIALILKNLGYEVSGSDTAKSNLTNSLENAGIKIYYEHLAQNCIGASVVVYSTAINQDNPEIKYAQDNKIPVIPRAEMLAELMRMKFSIAVSGTHGKTTVTSLIGAVLEHAEFNPTVIIGGRVIGADTGAKLGTSEYLVAEADESDRSFLLLYPTIAVVTNIEREHLDYYRNISDIKKAFIEFVNKTPFFGSVILGIDCAQVRKIIPMIKRDFITFGTRKDAQVRAEKIRLFKFHSQFTLRYNGQSFDFKINLAGKHNIENALATICVGLKLEIPLTKITQSLESFKGVHRRLELKGEKRGITVFDDYGHHPTEIKATLTALRNAYPDNRIITVFQPHRYTRTKFLANDFGLAFNTTDIVILTKIYPASETPIPGVTSEIIIESMHGAQNKGHRTQNTEIVYKENFKDITTYLLNLIRPNDVVITLGAGNIWQIGEELLNRLSE
jgi:UDP-N-acetylmuramate--alanine ligase